MRHYDKYTVSDCRTEKTLYMERCGYLLILPPLAVALVGSGRAEDGGRRDEDPQTNNGPYFGLLSFLGEETRRAILFVKVVVEELGNIVHFWIQGGAILRIISMRLVPIIITGVAVYGRKSAFIGIRLTWIGRFRSYCRSAICRFGGGTY